ncbi:MAG TPA: outer membrane beta-barrel protein [Candidatus Aquabacterium excrementipullorum]|nr:outer membrane beta-barrel protein [Candidatus Aquabacterium excrementipullorum]
MKKIVLAAVLAVVGGAASAEGYVGVVAGVTKINSECSAGFSCDDSDSGYKVYGGYEVAPNIAIEVAYTDFGKTSFDYGSAHAEIKGSAVAVLGALRGQFSNDWAGVARLGLASVKGKASSNFGYNGSESNVKPYASFGVEYAVTKGLKITGSADFTQVEYDGDSGAAYLVGVGLQYNF